MTQLLLVTTASPRPSPTPARGSAAGAERRHLRLCGMRVVPYRACVGSAKESVVLNAAEPVGAVCRGGPSVHHT